MIARDVISIARKAIYSTTIAGKRHTLHIYIICIGYEIPQMPFRKKHIREGKNKLGLSFI